MYLQVLPESLITSSSLSTQDVSQSQNLDAVYGFEVELDRIVLQNQSDPTAVTFTALSGGLGASTKSDTVVSVGGVPQIQVVDAQLSLLIYPDDPFGIA
jgi:hypothetical protein